MVSPSSLSYGFAGSHCNEVSLLTSPTQGLDSAAPSAHTILSTSSLRCLPWLRVLVPLPCPSPSECDTGLERKRGVTRPGVRRGVGGPEGHFALWGLGPAPHIAGVHL